MTNVKDEDFDGCVQNLNGLQLKVLIKNWKNKDRTKKVIHAHEYICVLWAFSFTFSLYVNLK